MYAIRSYYEILSFNPTAEAVSGFSQAEVKGKFWVDVLISPEKRAESQNRFSRVLKGGQAEMNFQAELETRGGERRIIEWHGSVRVITSYSIHYTKLYDNVVCVMVSSFLLALYI